MSEGKEILKKIRRPKSFVDENELLFYFDEYLKECKENEEFPNLAGFARKCFCSKETLWNYNVEGHEYFNTMKMIMTYLEDATINNKMSDNFKKFYMTNTFRNDYKDKQEISSTIDAKVETNSQDVEELKNIISTLNQSTKSI